MQDLIRRLNKAESKSQAVYIVWLELKNTDCYKTDVALINYLTLLVQNGAKIDFGYIYQRLLKYAYSTRFNELYFNYVKKGYRPVFIQTAIADCCEVSHGLVKAWIMESTQVRANYIHKLESFNITDYEFIEGKAQKIGEGDNNA